VVFIIQKAQTFLLSFRVERGIPGILLCLIIAWFQGFFTPLALHAYGDAAFTPRFATLRAGGPVAKTLTPLDFVKHHHLDHSQGSGFFEPLNDFSVVAEYGKFCEYILDVNEPANQFRWKIDESILIRAIVQRLQLKTTSSKLSTSHGNPRAIE